jgi:hypothetical protein
MSNRTQRCPVCGLLLVWGIPPMMRCGLSAPMGRLSEASEIVCQFDETWSRNLQSPCHITNHIVDLRPSPSEQLLLTDKG